jgi:hypothetical protein
MGLEENAIDERAVIEPVMLGALVGWKSFLTEHGVALRLQTVSSLEQAAELRLSLHDITLNARQMRALAHSLTEMADNREGVRRPKRRPWFI